MSEEPYTKVALLSELPEKGFIVRAAGETQLVICQLKGEVFVVENMCSHAFARFDEGRLRGNRLMCPLHGACFDVRNGQPFGPPASRPIRIFKTRTDGDAILVDLSE